MKNGQRPDLLSTPAAAAAAAAAVTYGYNDERASASIRVYPALSRGE